MNSLKSQLQNLVQPFCKHKIDRTDQVLFKYGLNTFNLLKVAVLIKDLYDISLESLFKNTNYTFLTIDNLDEKIQAIIQEQ